MRNNPAFIRVLEYVNANSVTLAQIRVVTDEQLLNVMWPNTNGVKPSSNHATPAMVRLCLREIYRERTQEARRQALYDNVAAAIGIAVVSVEALGDRRYVVELDGEE